MMKFSDKVEVVTESNKRMGTIIWECDCIGSHRGKKNFAGKNFRLFFLKKNKQKIRKSI